MKLEVQSFILLLAAFLTVCSRTVLGWRSFKVIFTSFPFELKGDVVDVRVQIQNTTGESTLSVALTVMEDIDDVYLKYAIGVEAAEGNYTTLINRSVNFCKFLKQRTSDPFLRVIYEDLLKQSNLMKVCPIRKGSYALREYRLDEEMLPSYMPETNFFIDMRLDRSNGAMLFRGRLNGQIDKSKGFNNLKLFSLG